MARKRKGASEWDTYIANNNTEPVINTLWLQTFDRLIDKIPRKRIKSIFEIGCSTGRVLAWLHRRFPAKLYGIDLNDSGAAECRKRKVHFRIGDARDIPINADSFDMTLSLGVIEHFATPTIRAKLISEQMRVTAPGGYIIITTPTLIRTSLMHWHIRLVEDRRNPYRHYSVSKREVVRELRRQGAEIMHASYEGWFFEPHGIPWFLRIPQTSQVMMVFARKPAKHAL